MHGVGVVIWLSGGVPFGMRERLSPTLGLMCTAGRSNMPERGRPWALDNGAFGAAFNGGAAFDADFFRSELRRFQPWLDTCLFAVAPDVICDPIATLARSEPWLSELREFGYPAAFASQDGATSETVPWAKCDCLFVGGSDRWKFSDASLALVAEAKRRGLWVHAGRVQASRRLVLAAAVGIDSADGTSLRYDPARLDRSIRNIDRANRQLALPGAFGATDDA